MKFILYGVGSFSTLCTVVIFIYLLDTGPAETGSSVSSDAASEPLMPYIALLFGIIFILVFGGVILHLLSARKQSLRLIQTELDEGKRMYKETWVSGVVNGVRYRGPLLKLAVFDDCFIIKDKKVPFADIESISKSRFSGFRVQNKSNKADIFKSNNGQSIVVYSSSFLQFIPKEHGGQKEPGA
jgi:hypothetical protein